MYSAVPCTDSGVVVSPHQKMQYRVVDPSEHEGKQAHVYAAVQEALKVKAVVLPARAVLGARRHDDLRTDGAEVTGIS